MLDNNLKDHANNDKDKNDKKANNVNNKNNENDKIETEQVGELMKESLESATLYSWKLKIGVRELIEEIEEYFIGRNINFISPEKILPAVKTIISGVEWLVGIYDRCRFFSSAPIYQQEDNLVKLKIVTALKTFVNYVEAGDAYNILKTLKFELSPMLELLDGRIKMLSSSAGLLGVKKGIVIQ